MRSLRVAGVAGLFECAVATAEAASLRPNIVWVMADDLGWGEVGLYPAVPPMGRRRIETPHLDAFGNEGIVFHHAYAGYTVCAPSRTTFFTGRHSGHFVQHGLSGTSLAPKQNVTTLAQVLQSAGYATGAFGKVAPLTDPLNQGFDAFVGQIDQSKCHNMYPEAIDTAHAEGNFDLSGNHGQKSRQLCMEHPELFNYTIDVFHEYGMQWLEAHGKGSDPFFLFLSYTIPHAGGWSLELERGAPVPTDLQYASEPWPNVEKDHAAVVSYLDGKVGDLLRRLKDLGIDEKTLVFFASDNGAHLEGGNSKDGFHSNLFFNSTGGLRGQKRSLYEGGVRSPTMVRWPGKIAPGSRSDFQWAFWDVLPTLAELAGGQAPAGLDGMSIVPTLLGEQQTPHDYMYFTWQQGGGVSVPGYSVRMGDWKGVVVSCTAKLKPRSDDKMQLFHLPSDPFETTDVAGEHPEVVQQLLQKVLSEDVACNCFQCSYGEAASIVV